MLGINLTKGLQGLEIESQKTFLEETKDDVMSEGLSTTPEAETALLFVGSSTSAASAQRSAGPQQTLALRQGFPCGWRKDADTPDALRRESQFGGCRSTEF